MHFTRAASSRKRTGNGSRLRLDCLADARRGVKRSAVRAPEQVDLLSSVLASGALARLVTHFAVWPEERPHARALQRHTGLTSRSLQIELARLERLGVIQRRVEAQRVIYVLNESTPCWRVLRQLVRELADPVDLIRDVLSDAPGIVAGFVVASFARGDVREHGDVDVLVLGEAIPEDIFARRTLDAGVLLYRKVNVSMSRDELRRRLRTGSGFLPRVLAGSKRWLVGDEGMLGADRPLEWQYDSPDSRDGGTCPRCRSPSRAAGIPMGSPSAARREDACQRGSLRHRWPPTLPTPPLPRHEGLEYHPELILHLRLLRS